MTPTNEELEEYYRRLLHYEPPQRRQHGESSMWVLFWTLVCFITWMLVAVLFAIRAWPS